MQRAGLVSSLVCLAAPFTHKDIQVTEDYSSFESASEAEDDKDLKDPGAVVSSRQPSASSIAKAEPAAQEESLGAESDPNPPTNVPLVEEKKSSTSSASKKGPPVASSKSASTAGKPRRSGQQTLAGFFKK